MALFPSPSSSPLAGMTVNERLFERGLFAAFDAAARRRDRTALLGVLTQLDLTVVEAEGIADAVLSDPAKYGY